MSENVEPELETLSFTDLHLHSIGLGLKLQIRWFFQPQNSPKHLMPFLSRNLLYIRRARGYTGRGKKKKTRKVNTSQATYTGQKTSDLLFKLFKHQPVMYNDALLENPRSATRKRTQANARNAMGKPIIVVDVDAGVNKRKRDGAPSVDLLSVADENRMNLSLGEENVADNGTYTSSVAMNGKKLRLPEPYAKDSFCADSVLSSAETRSVTGSGNGVYLSSTAKAQTPMFIHYLSLAKNGFPLDYVEEKQDRRCPFCFHDAVSDSGIVLHLSECQGDMYDIKSARSEVGQLHITATFHPKNQLMEGKEQLNDFVFVARPRKMLPSVPFVQCSAQKVASLDVATRKKSIRLLEELGADEKSRKSFAPDDKVPIRQYFHSKTCQPMVGGDWDVDSDDDSTTDQWLMDTTTALLDDFTDLDSNEKKFMKLWNHFAHSHTIIADRSMPERCLAFIKEHAVKLKAEDLRQELVLHLHNLWDHGVVSSDDVVACMMEYDSTGDWV